MEPAVRPERLLKELRNLWVDLAKDEPSGVIRSCVMTLILVVDEKHDAMAIGETLAKLMHEHPSRAIVLRVGTGTEPSLSARVFAQCWMPFGSRQQICCEQVEIVSSLGSLSDVTSVLRGLVVADLPVVMYCPSETLWKLPEFQALLPLATKLIIDSTEMSNAPAALTFLQSLPQARGLRKADLMWSRLSPWRESIAQVFENPTRMRSIYQLEEIRILYHAPHGEPSSVYYLAGWFMSILGGGVKIQIAPGAGPDYAHIAHIALIGPDLKATLDLGENNAVNISANGEHLLLTMFPPMSECEALRRELSIAGRDVRFEDALGLGQVMYGKQ